MTQADYMKAIDRYQHALAMLREAVHWASPERRAGLEDLVVAQAKRLERACAKLEEELERKKSCAPS